MPCCIVRLNEWPIQGPIRNVVWLLRQSYSAALSPSLLHVYCLQSNGVAGLCYSSALFWHVSPLQGNCRTNPIVASRDAVQLQKTSAQPYSGL